MRLLKILALVLTATALIPSAAHLFELAGKIDLEREHYFTVQSIYAGWSMFGIPIFAAILANLALAVAYWRVGDRRALLPGLAAILIAGSLANFFLWVFPGNKQTANWTSQPDNWELLRRNWEYGHATNALIAFAAFVLTCVASAGSDRRKEERQVADGR